MWADWCVVPGEPGMRPWRRSECTRRGRIVGRFRVVNMYAGLGHPLFITIVAGLWPRGGWVYLLCHIVLESLYIHPLLCCQFRRRDDMAQFGS